MRRRTGYVRVLALGLSVAAAQGLPAGDQRNAEAEAAASPAPTVAVEEVENGTRIQALLPGRRIVATAFARGPQGVRAVLLVAPLVPAVAPPSADAEPDPGRRELPPCPGEPGAVRALWTFALDRPGTLRALAELPPGASRVEALDADGDGIDELLVAAPPALLQVDADGTVTTLLEDAGAAVDAFIVSGDPDDARFALARWGAIALYAPGEDGAWAATARAALPLHGGSWSRELRAASPVPRLLGVAPDGAWVFAENAAQLGDRRLRVRLVRLGPGSASAEEEAWARLPSAERLTASSVHLVEGEPRLIALTQPADKMSFFGDRGLRVWSLRHDRSRLGREPLLVAETRANMMQEARPHWTDVDGDGAADLVLAYYRGLVGKDAALEVWLRAEDGALAPRRRTTALGAKRADGSFPIYGEDVDGDGVADLVVRADDRFRVHPGWRNARGKNIVQDRAFELPAPQSSAPGVREVRISSAGSAVGAIARAGETRVADVDGDGRAEIVTVETGSADAPARLTILRR